MKELEGDFWAAAPEYDALVCTINLVVKKNGDLVMGAGIARQFADKFWGLPTMWGAEISRILKENKVPDLVFNLPMQKLCAQYLIGLPTKIHWQDSSTFPLIERSLTAMVDFVNEEKIYSVLMTRPGCANGGLKWFDVRPICVKYLDDRFTVIDR